MRKNLISISSIVLSVVLFSMSVFAQSQTGDITGTVSDPNGAVVPNATVTVTGISIGFNRTATTDSSGFYAIRSVPAGTYNVSVAAVSGFAAQTVKNQTVVLETTTTVNIALAIQGGGAVVNVTDNQLVAPVDTTESKVQTNVTAAKIDLLPKGVDFTSVIRTAPGTRSEGLAGGFSVDGASGSENVFIIDGQEVTNFRTGTLNGNNAIPTQFVQEVQVKSSGFEAEFGGATGGVINVVTKGGSNDFHGEFGTQFNSAKLNGNPRPSLVRITTVSPAAIEYVNAPKAGGYNFFPTANFTGPIIKDKVWFSTSYSPQVYVSNVRTNFYTNAPASTRTLVQSQTYNSTTTYNYAFARIDASPISTVRLSTTYLWNPIVQQGVIPFGTYSIGGGPASVNFGGTIGTLSGQDLYSRQGGRQNSNNFTLQGSWTPTSSLIISARFSRGFLNEKLGNYMIPGTQTRYLCQIQNTSVANGCRTAQNDPDNSIILRDISVRQNWEADASYFLNAGKGGRHEIKGGYQRFRITNDVDRGYVNTGRMYMWYNPTSSYLDNISIEDLGAASTPTCVGACVRDADGIITNPAYIGSGYYLRFGTKGIGSNTNQSLYFQDKAQFGRLTINAGIRFEKEDLPSFNNLAPPINFGWGDKIAPRIGASFSLNKAGTAKIFGSYGKFFDRLKFELPRGSFGGDFYRLDFFEIFASDGPYRSAFTRPVILGSFNDAPGGSCPVTGFIAPGARSRCQFDYRIASNNPNATIFDGKVDPNLHPFQQDEITIGYQQELSRNYVLSARYTNKRVVWAVEDAGVRNNAGSEAYILGNPGSGLHLQLLQQLGYTKSTTPQRDYNGFDISLDKRLANHYYFNLNYTYSRLYGNYSGLASSDEAGRTSPGVNRFFDLPHLGWTATGQKDNGLLATDRPNVFNAYGAYIFDWMGSKTNSTELSFFQTFQSGTPQTTFISYITALPFTKRGDLGRTPMLSQTDFMLSHKYKFGRDDRFTLAADLNILNLWDQRIVTGLFTTKSAVTLSPATFGLSEVAGANAWTSGALLSQINTYLAGAATRTDGRYGMASGYQGPRSVRFGFRLIF
jgi:hypothetical protein